MIYNILIGGSAGQGMDTLSGLIQKILKRRGFNIFSNKDYMSRIRGGHNFIQIRFGDEEVHTHHPDLDLIIALDENTIVLHRERLLETGIIIGDEKLKSDDKKLVKIPMRKIAREIGNSRVFGSVALGSLLKLFNISYDNALDVFNDRFNENISMDNFKALKMGYDLLDTQFKPLKEAEDKNILINSNDAIALGALAGGLDFYSAYPMTPATSIMTYLSKKQEKAGIVVEQVEDELAAINMALGASFAGARSMTGTSGGGYSLMTEALGLAGITETPLVTVNVMRPGPATGLPTRTEQSDLSFVLTASHGEIPRMVMAVRNPEDAFYQTARALNIADKYQMLVILLNDQYLADAMQTINAYDFSKITINRHLASKDDIDVNDYKRYKLTKSGISPRIIPGQIEGVTVLADSDEHCEYGHITEDAKVRVDMMNKRMKRMELLKEELVEPEFFGDSKPDTLLIGWGSMYGPLKEGIKLLQEDGISVGALVFGDIYPLPTKLLNKYSKMAKNIVNVEQNYTGQLGKLITGETTIAMDKSILKYDGRQLNGLEIYERVKGEVL